MLSAVDAAIRLEQVGIDPDTAEAAIRAHLDHTGRTAPNGSTDDAYLDDHELATLHATLQAGDHAPAADAGRPAEPTPVEDSAGYAEETFTHREAAERLTELGYDPTTAQTMVTDYLDDTSREIGVSVHQWGLDQHDVDAIAAHPERPGNAPAVPPSGAPSASRSDVTSSRSGHTDDQALADVTVDATVAVEER